MKPSSVLELLQYEEETPALRPGAIDMTESSQAITPHGTLEVQTGDELTLRVSKKINDTLLYWARQDRDFQAFLKRATETPIDLISAEDSEDGEDLLVGHTSPAALVFPKKTTALDRILAKLRG